MNRKVFSLMVLALGGMFLAATAWAQNSTGTVEAIGIQRVRVQPKAIRFVYLIQASGKTPEGAVKLLQIQRDAALPITRTIPRLCTARPQRLTTLHPHRLTTVRPQCLTPSLRLPHLRLRTHRLAANRLRPLRLATRLPRLISCRRRPCRPTRNRLPHRRPMQHRRCLRQARVP
jgi:hypothetical protein